MKVVKKVNQTKEQISAIEVIKRLADEKKAVSFEQFYDLFCKELAKISKSQSNRKTRARRLLYRNVNSSIVKQSEQSKKYNLALNTIGIKIKTKYPIEFIQEGKKKGDAITKTVDNNIFSFVVGKNLRPLTKDEIEAKRLKEIEKIKAKDKKSKNVK